MRNASGSARLGIVVALVIVCAGGAVAQPRELSRATIQEAIDFGLDGDLQPYFLRHARDRSGGTNDVVVAALYTPYLRVAFAARSARDEGRLLDPDDLPDWLVAPELLLAVRWYMGERCEFEPAMVAPLVTAVPQGTVAIPPHSVSGWRPLRAYPGAAELRRYGIPLPFADVAAVVSYPVNLVSGGVDVLVSKYGLRDGREGACVERARVLAADSSSWR